MDKNNKQLNELLKKAQERLGLGFRQTESLSFGTERECKNMIWSTMLHYDKSITKDTIKWLDEYNEVANWLSNTKGKGLLMTGQCGTGKTLLLKFAIPTIFHIKKNRIVRFYHAKQSINKEVANEMTKQRIIAIDDIGSETFLNNYGQKISIIHDIILASEEENKTLLLTSNLTSKELEEKYDTRALDRLKKMCRIVNFKGKSLR